MVQVETELSVVFGHDVHWRTVAWPILRSTEKAWLLSTVGGEVWMPMWRWRLIRRSQDAVQLNQVCDLFTNVSSTHNDSRVSVRKAGRGSTDKSHCVAFSVRVKEDVRAEWQPAVKNRTAIVPMSQLLPSAGGGWTVPRWVLERKLNRSKELIDETSVWTGLAPVIAQLQAAFDAASASVATAIEACERRSGSAQIRRGGRGFARRAGCEPHRMRPVVWLIDI